MEEAPLRRLLAVHRQRLGELEVQAATMGYSAPTHITMEIDDIKKAITQIESDLKTLEISVGQGPSREVLSSMDAVDRYKVFITIALGLQQEFTDFKGYFKEFRVMTVVGFGVLVVLLFVVAIVLGIMR